MLVLIPVSSMKTSRSRVELGLMCAPALAATGDIGSGPFKGEHRYFDAQPPRRRNLKMASCETKIAAPPVPPFRACSVRLGGCAIRSVVKAPHRRDARRRLIIDRERP